MPVHLSESTHTRYSQRRTYFSCRHIYLPSYWFGNSSFSLSLTDGCREYERVVGALEWRMRVPLTAPESEGASFRCIRRLYALRDRSRPLGVAVPRGHARGRGVYRLLAWPRGDGGTPTANPTNS